MGDRAAKDRLYDAFAEVGRALASGRRLELLDVLAQGERTVEVVAAEIGQSVANTSNHLRALARAGLVASRRAGAHVHYRLAGPPVERLWAALREVAAAHVDGLPRAAEGYLGDRTDVEVVARAEVARLLGRSGTALLDVRPLDEYRAGHLPGAIPVPPGDLDRALAAVAGEAGDAVAYCRGPYCVYADDAVRTLRRRGVRARRLEDGFPEWRLAGLPVVDGDPGDAA